MAITYAQNVGLVKTPPRIEIQGIIYNTVTINGLVWITEELKNPVSGADVVLNNTRYYAKRKLSNVQSILPTGWRVATESDFTNLSTYYSSDKKALCATSGWNGLGTNQSGMNFVQLGCTDSGSSIINSAKNVHIVDNYTDRCFVIEISSNSIVSRFYTVGSSYYTIRICKNA